MEIILVQKVYSFVLVYTIVGVMLQWTSAPFRKKNVYFKCAVL